MENITYAYLETTSYCNLKCSFCNRKDVIKNKILPLMHMVPEKWDIILEKLKRYDIQEAKLYGLGEPFLNPHLETLLIKFKEQYPKCYVICSTNCQYIAPNLEECMKYIDMLYLSIDGYKENYERDRVNAKWNKLIKYLENIKNMNRHSCTLAVNYVINKYNIQDIPKIKSIIKEYNLDKLRLNIASNWSENSKISDNNKTWNYSKEQIKQLKKYKSEIMGKSPWTFSNCFWPHNGIYVRVDGLVTVCVMNTNTKPFGNIYEQSIEDIRNSERFIKIKNGCINDNPDDHCKNCSYKELSSLLEIIGVNNKSKFGRNEK